MSGEPSGSGSTGGGSASAPPKAIGSLAKKPSDVTRQGSQKLKFVPTLPARKKKATEAKPEPADVALPATPSTQRGRGRGRGEGRGSGRGRGDGKGRGDARPQIEMTASGPFAMGPALAGNNARRVAPRTNIAVPTSSSTPSISGIGLKGPTLKRELGSTEIDRKGKGKEKEEPVDDKEVYSDPEEGVEIIDMDDVREMDWMAPESLKKEKKREKKPKKIKIKEEHVESKLPLSAKPDVEMDVEEAAAKGEVDLANAIDLEESEEEEEMEDLINDFAFAPQTDENPDIRQERLYLFQFPSPFPTFISPSAMSTAAEPAAEAQVQPSPKKVSFAPDTKMASATPETEQQSASASEPKVDGIIGDLVIYESGAVKLRIANGILLDVRAATQPSFYQQAVHLDLAQKRMSALGEVSKRFVVSPDVDALLSAMELEDNKPVTIEGEENMIAMDTS